MDATKATVHVEIPGGTGAPTCLDGTTFDSTAATSCSPTVATGDGGVGGVIVPPPPDGGTTVTGSGGARVDAGSRDAASASTGSGGSGTTGPGAGGSTGAGGASVVADSGSGTAGDIGVGGTAGTSVVPPIGQDAAVINNGTPGGPGAVQGGCSCRVGANSPANRGNDMAAGLAIVAGLVGTRVRRRRRA
jgi:MYXO-CTERM domain-containing protein